MKYLPEKDDWTKFDKNNVTIAVNFLYSKKEKMFPPMYQNITQIMKNKLFSNDFKWRERKCS